MSDLEEVERLAPDAEVEIDQHHRDLEDGIDQCIDHHRDRARQCEKDVRREKEGKGRERHHGKRDQRRAHDDCEHPDQEDDQKDIDPGSSLESHDIKQGRN